MISLHEVRRVVKIIETEGRGSCQGLAEWGVGVNGCKLQIYTTERVLEMVVMAAQQRECIWSADCLLKDC